MGARRMGNKKRFDSIASPLLDSEKEAGDGDGSGIGSDTGKRKWSATKVIPKLPQDALKILEAWVSVQAQKS